MLRTPTRLLFALALAAPAAAQLDGAFDDLAAGAPVRSVMEQLAEVAARVHDARVALREVLRAADTEGVVTVWSSLPVPYSPPRRGEAGALLFFDRDRFAAGVEAAGRFSEELSRATEGLATAARSLEGGGPVEELCEFERQRTRVAALRFMSRTRWYLEGPAGTDRTLLFRGSLDTARRVPAPAADPEEAATRLAAAALSMSRWRGADGALDRRAAAPGGSREIDLEEFEGTIKDQAFDLREATTDLVADRNAAFLALGSPASLGAVDLEGGDRAAWEELEASMISVGYWWRSSVTYTGRFRRKRAFHVLPRELRETPSHLRDMTEPARALVDVARHGWGLDAASWESRAPVPVPETLRDALLPGGGTGSRGLARGPGAVLVP